MAYPKFCILYYYKGTLLTPPTLLIFRIASPKVNFHVNALSQHPSMQNRKKARLIKEGGRKGKNYFVF